MHTLNYILTGHVQSCARQFRLLEKQIGVEQDLDLPSVYSTHVYDIMPATGACPFPALKTIYQDKRVRSSTGLLTLHTDDIKRLRSSTTKLNAIVDD